MSTPKLSMLFIIPMRRPTSRASPNSMTGFDMSDTKHPLKILAVRQH